MTETNSCGEMLNLQAILINGTETLVEALAFGMQHDDSFDVAWGKWQGNADTAFIANDLGCLACGQFKI